MKTFSKILVVVLVLSMVFTLVACSSDKDKKAKLIGTWVFKQLTEEMTFKEDGTFTYNLYGYSTGTGTYEVKDGKLTMNYDTGNTVTGTIDFPDSTTLYLTSEQLGGTAIYNKK